jgi:phosphatidylserine/phosphatidylglycerophosphate/cardiolipin synthase-like enzyme/V8-like Glu-specific endopeptidase
MATFIEQQLEQISAAVSRLLKAHPELLEKARAKIKLAESVPTTTQVLVTERSPADDCGVKTDGSLIDIAKKKPAMFRLPAEIQLDGNSRVEELIALSIGRPAILISNGDYDLAQHEDLPELVREALLKNRDRIRKILPAIGRIEVKNHPRYSWLGTGFLVRADIVATNRHVAVEIAYRGRDGKYEFIAGAERPKKVSPSIDNKEEFDSPAEGESKIVDVLYIDDGSGPDLAFLKLERARGGAEVDYIRFRDDAKNGEIVAAVGYPAKDTRANDLPTVLQILGDVYNKKRLSPGLLGATNGNEIFHDCSTLGGNSGSPILDVTTGMAVGLHAGGYFPNINYGVSAKYIMNQLDKVSSGISGSVPADIPIQTQLPPVAQSASSVPAQTTAILQTNIDGSMTWEIPLRVSVSLSAPRLISGIGASLPGKDTDAALAEAQQLYGSLPGVVRIKSGFVARNNQLTDIPAIVVCLDRTAYGADQTAGVVAKEVLSTPAQIQNASATDFLAARGLDVTLEKVPTINYQMPEDLSLDLVEEEMSAIFHVSPDAGWPELQKFLAPTQKSLTIGLYNLSIEHGAAALFEAVEPGRRTFHFVLGAAGVDDEEIKEFENRLIERLKEQLPGRRFKYARGEDTGRRLFAGHYHIKLAVRDHTAFWLSSGNWDKSNQPDIDPVTTGEKGWWPLNSYNREWHAIIENRKLAEMFEEYIKYDLESYQKIPEGAFEPIAEPLFLVPEQMMFRLQERQQGDAQYFSPLRLERRRLKIQPLLSPDNYHEHVLRVIETATDSIVIQNQSYKWKDTADERFAELGNAILRKQQRNGVNVRIIIRAEYGGAEQKTWLKKKGFRDEQIRLQNKCHTKGIVVDDETVVLGSHNWTDHGVLANRDASLIVYDREVAEYFKKIFEFDWKRASELVPEMPPGITIYQPGDRVPQGYRVMSWQDLV